MGIMTDFIQRMKAEILWASNEDAAQANSTNRIAWEGAWKDDKQDAPRKRVGIGTRLGGMEGVSSAVIECHLLPARL